MEKKIKIGNTEILMKATAATALHYRNQFKGHDLIKEMSQFDVKDIDMSVLERLAYIMSGAFKDGTTLEDWLEQFEPIELINALGDVVELWSGNETSQNIPNSKNV